MYYKIKELNVKEYQCTVYKNIKYIAAHYTLYKNMVVQYTIKELNVKEN